MAQRRSAAARRSSLEACSLCVENTNNGIYHQLLIMPPVWIQFQLWAPATKHLAFIFNRTSLSNNNVERSQRPYLICQTDIVNIQTEKKISYTHVICHLGGQIAATRKPPPPVNGCCREVSDPVPRSDSSSLMRGGAPFLCLLSKLGLLCELLSFQCFLVQRAAKANRG